MQLIDIGVNLADASFDADRDAVIRRAAAAGVGQMIVTGTGLEESEAALALAQEDPATFRCTAGIHPHLAARWTDSPREARARLGAVLESGLAVAAGECGLDYFRNLSPPDAQRVAFAGQLEPCRGVREAGFSASAGRARRLPGDPEGQQGARARRRGALLYRRA